MRAFLLVVFEHGRRNMRERTINQVVSVAGEACCAGNGKQPSDFLIDGRCS
jgi:hypothetical protein